MARADSWNPTKLEERIDRIDSLEQIRQLPHRYALCIDSRNMDDLVELFVEDVRVGKDEFGRDALKRWFSDTLGRIGASIHFVGNHVIDFDDADHASGVVYCRDEIERPNKWDVGYIQYWDRYERIDGRWLFRRRLPLYWYASDLNAPPIGPEKMRWPDRDCYEGGFHAFFPSWERFWEQAPDGSDVPAPAPIEQFLESFREGLPEKLSVRVR